jgi:hypothetical protein
MMAAQSRMRLLEGRTEAVLGLPNPPHRMRFAPQAGLDPFMTCASQWSANPYVEEFDALQQDPARWIGTVSALAARYSAAPAVPAGKGTIVLALLDLALRGPYHAKNPSNPQTC